MDAMKWMLPALVLSMPVVALGQSNDMTYCSALADKYQRYVNMDTKNAPLPQSLDVRVAADRCGAGDAAASIPVLEKALQNARLTLPPRA